MVTSHGSGGPDYKSDWQPPPNKSGKPMQQPESVRTAASWRDSPITTVGGKVFKAA